MREGGGGGGGVGWRLEFVAIIRYRIFALPTCHSLSFYGNLLSIQRRISRYTIDDIGRAVSSPLHSTLWRVFWDRIRFPSVNTIQMEIRHRFRSSIPAVFRIPSSFGISQNNFRSSRYFFQRKEEFKLFHQGTSKKKIWRLTKKFNIPNHLYRKREKFIASRSALPFTEKNGNRGWLSRGERKR